MNIDEIVKREKKFTMRFTRIELIFIQQLCWKLLNDSKMPDQTKDLMKKIENRINRKTALTMYNREKFPLEFTILSELGEKLGIQLWR